MPTAYRTMRAVQERRNMSARLTPEAREAWDAACTRNRCTATALIEQLGLMLAEGYDWIPAEAVERARALDRQRYSRGD